MIILATTLKVLSEAVIMRWTLKINKAVRNSTLAINCKLLQRQTVQLKKMS
jgi:hypothetical protein